MQINEPPRLSVKDPWGLLCLPELHLGKPAPPFGEAGEGVSRVSGGIGGHLRGSDLVYPLSRSKDYGSHGTPGIIVSVGVSVPKSETPLPTGWVMQRGKISEVPEVFEAPMAGVD